MDIRALNAITSPSPTEFERFVLMAAQVQLMRYTSRKRASREAILTWLVGYVYEHAGEQLPFKPKHPRSVGLVVGVVCDIIEYRTRG
jgi:hypothetical protein